MKKRILSLFLVLLMIVSSLPVPAYAEDGTGAAEETACEVCGTIPCTCDVVEDVCLIGYLNKSVENISFYDNADQVKTVAAADCPDFLILTRKIIKKSLTQDEQGNTQLVETVWYMTDSLDDAFWGEVVVRYAFTEGANFTAVTGAAGLYATFGSSEITLYKDLSVATDAKQAVLDGEYTVADFCYNASLCGWFVKLVPGENWPAEASGYVWANAFDLATLTQTPTQQPEEPENACRCCESCTGAEGCTCGCENCDFCEKEEEPTCGCCESCTDAEGCACGCEDCDFCDAEVEKECPTCGELGCESEHLNWCDFCKKDDCGEKHISATVTDANGNQQTVTVTGDALPEGATLTVAPMANQTSVMEELNLDGGYMWDIKVFDADGNQWQPAAGETVKLTLPVAGAPDDALVTIAHILDFVPAIQSGIAADMVDVEDVSDYSDLLKQIFAREIAACQEATGRADCAVTEYFEELSVSGGYVMLNVSSFSVYTWNNGFQKTSTGDSNEIVFCATSGGSTGSYNAVYYVTSNQSIKCDTGGKSLAAFMWEASYDGTNFLGDKLNGTCVSSISSGDKLGERIENLLNTGITFNVGTDENVYAWGNVFWIRCIVYKWGLFSGYSETDRATVKFIVISERYVYYHNNATDPKNCTLPGTSTWKTTYWSDQWSSRVNPHAKVDPSNLIIGTPTNVQTGYHFTHWTDQFGNTITSGTAVTTTTGNLNLYANFEPNSYTITFKYNGGKHRDTGSTADVVYTTYYDSMDYYGVESYLHPVKEGYIFTGWYTEDGTQIYDKNGVCIPGTAYWSDAQTWKATSNLVVYAHWTAKSFTVEYKANGGTGTMANSSATYKQTTKISDNGFTAPTGKKFVGWTTNSNGTNDGYGWFTTSNGNAVGWSGTWNWDNGQYGIANDGLILYAMWEKIPYTITYDLVDGVLESGKNNPVGFDVETATFTLNNPFKEGYTFSGWTGSNGTTPQTTVAITKGSTGNRTYTANYSANIYHVTLDKNGGSGGTDEYYYRYKTKVSHGESGTDDGGYAYYYTDAACTNYMINGTGEDRYYHVDVPTKVGYTFMGYQHANGTIYVDANGTCVENIYDTIPQDSTLVAQWQANTYTVKFHGNGATSGSMADQSFTYGESKALTAEGFTRSYTVTYERYNGSDTVSAEATFKGWATSPNGEVVYTDGQTVSNLTTEDGVTIDLYAVWQLETITIPAPSSRPGYTFGGWDKDGTICQAGDTYTPTSNVKFTEVWTINVYTVTFNYNDGTGKTESRTITYDTAYGTLPAASRDGYRFNGWFTETTSGIQVTASTVYQTAGDTTLYAQWDAVSYDVAFNGNGATSGTMANQGFFYDNERSLTPNAYAREHTVSFNTNGGSASHGPVTKTAAFQGWATTLGGAKVYGDQQPVSNLTKNNGDTVTLYAVWSFETVTLPDPGTRNGYAFAGWSDGSAIYAVGADYIADSTVTLVAQWTILSYDISYNLDGGTVATANPDKYTVETTSFTLNDPTKTGYTFVGWTGTGIAGTAMTVTVEKGSIGHRSYTATWNVNTYTVTYNYMGGSGGDADKKVTYDEKYGELPTPNRTGYTFVGWYTQEAGGTKVTADTLYQIDGNSTIYAHWTPNSYTLSIYGNQNNAESTTCTVTYDSTDGRDLSSHIQTKNGYQLKGLYTGYGDTGDRVYDENGQYIPNTQYWNANGKWIYEDDLRLVGYWEKITYTLTYDYGYLTDGQPTTGSITYDVESSLTLAEAPTRPGYEFQGWMLETAPADSSWAATTYTASQALGTGNYGNVTLVAQWKRSLVDLTITTTCADSEQSFIFTITGTPEDTGYGTVTLDVVLVGTDSIVIRDLPAGEYTITEKDGWSWRENAVADIKVDLKQTSGTANFNFQVVDQIYWLSGCSYYGRRKKGGS